MAAAVIPNVRYLGETLDSPSVECTERSPLVKDIGDYFTFNVRKVKNVLSRRKDGKWRRLSYEFDSQSSQTSIKGRLTRLFSVGSGAVQDEETWLLSPRRSRLKSLDEPQQGTKSASGLKGAVVEAGVRVGGALRHAGHWLVEGLRGYVEFGNPNINPGMNGFPGVEDFYYPYCATLPY